MKIPISDNPFNDHVVAATFWIRSKKALYDAIRTMMKHEIKTNNEYYLDNLPLAFNLLNKKSCIFDVDLLVGWGTPKELFEFDKIWHFYRYGSLDELDLTDEHKKLWLRYFKGE